MTYDLQAAIAKTLHDPYVITPSGESDLELVAYLKDHANEKASDRADAVMSVLRSKEFREWALGECKVLKMTTNDRLVFADLPDALDRMFGDSE